MLFDDDLRHTYRLVNMRTCRRSWPISNKRGLERPTQTRGAVTKCGQCRGGASPILISDLLSDVEEVVEGIEMLRQGNHEVIVLHVLDHDEREFPFQGQHALRGTRGAGSGRNG